MKIGDIQMSKHEIKSKSKFIIIGPGGMHGVQCTENIYQKRLAREHISRV